MTHTALEQAVLDGLKSFENDPTDSDFQRGFKAALEYLAEIISKAGDQS